MSYAPFNTNESGNIIALFMKDELFPAMKKISDLSIIISNYRIGFWGSFFRYKYKDLEKTYKVASSDFIKLYQKWSTPDILFKQLEGSDDKNKIGAMIGDYFNSNPAVMFHFNEGFRLLNYIDKILTSQETASYNRITIFLFLLSILISLMAFLNLK